MVIEFIKKHLFLVCVALFLIVFLTIFSANRNRENTSVPLLPTVMADQDNSKDNSHQIKSIVIIDVKGEVVKPGVYEVNLSDRVNDVIILAGGFTENADIIPVNLAQKVFDEMTIIVPTIGDQLIEAQSTGGQSKVRINYASKEEIETLPGIGPSKAQAILDYREEHGFYIKNEDLLNISGIGQKTLDKLLDQIQIP